MRRDRDEEDAARAAAGRAVFEAIETLARIAKGVDDAGRPIPERYRARASEALLRHGLATAEELGTLPPEALLERLGERLARRWGA